MPRAVRRAGGALVVAGCALATVAGCGLWGGPDVPDDFTTAEIETIEVSHPPGWDRSAARDEDGVPNEKVTAVDIVHEEEGVEAARVSVVHQMEFGRSPEFAVGVAVRQRNGVLPRYRDEREKVFNTGAEGAYRVDFSFEDPDGEVTGEEGATTKGIDIVMVGRDHYAHHVSVSWNPDRFDSATAEQIAETVYLHD
ncbi:putative small lipoprotein YifL [Lipingzhangella halophila]|uniref:Putative small lipoprotein YifL n=1 Tax=Lipingzhangella halophila TaxID=1783352 RepID=A0A7W7RL33_9ACTN|nr:hypothetical protein [Lipingzhangella halophila]MBB4933965.1 putative small lipoprotein YifL [Lipingzhangella halophila]